MVFFSHAVIVNTYEVESRNALGLCEKRAVKKTEKRYYNRMNKLIFIYTFHRNVFLWFYFSFAIVISLNM